MHQLPRDVRDVSHIHLRDVNGVLLTDDENRLILAYRSLSLTSKYYALQYIWTLAEAERGSQTKTDA